MNFDTIFSTEKTPFIGLGGMLLGFISPNIPDLDVLGKAVAVAAGFFGIILTIISIYVKIQEKVKNDLEIKELEKKRK